MSDDMPLRFGRSIVCQEGEHESCTGLRIYDRAFHGPCTCACHDVNRIVSGTDLDRA